MEVRCFNDSSALFIHLRFLDKVPATYRHDGPVDLLRGDVALEELVVVAVVAAHLRLEPEDLGSGQGVAHLQLW